MNKKTVKYICIISSLFFKNIKTRELKTPLEYFPDTTRRFKFLDKEERKSGFGLFCEGYYKTSEKAFTCNHGTNTEPLSTLLFGKSDFLGKEIFANAATYSAPNIWLNISTISIRFRRTERGSIFGATYSHKFKEDKLRLGIRAAIPFKIIDVERQTGCGDTGVNDSGELGGEGLSDVIKYQPENIDDTNNVSHGIIAFAYRLDFLSLLDLEDIGLGAIAPFVNYKNTSFLNHITIANQDITYDTFTTPIFAYRKNDSAEPDQFYQLETAAATNINANGENILNDAYGRFIRANDYTTLGDNSSLQKEYWIVPGIRKLAHNVEYTPEAVVIRQMVDDIINSDKNSAEDFFTAQGICFESQRSAGLGDLKIEFFTNYLTTESTHIEGIFGLTLPTAEKIKDPKILFYRPLGNNGHVETKFGLSGAWKPINWFQCTTDLSYSFALKRKENVAAAFEGATVKNINPTVQADVSWSYFLGNIAFNFFNPKTKYPLGITVRYELYAKRKNNICFNSSTTKDFFEETNKLDPDILAYRTNVIAHKGDLNLFYQTNNIEFFMGFSHVFAGKNAPKETKWNIGLIVAF